MSRPVLRFAPSPNGKLHLGHAYSALLNFGIAQANHGRFLLRIEDIDLNRCRPDFEQAVYEDLSWLGMSWEVPVRKQSEHFADYKQAFSRLRGARLIYPCFCSRKNIAANSFNAAMLGTDPDGMTLYSGSCRVIPGEESQERILAGENHAWRLDIHKALSLTGRDLFFETFSVDTDTLSFGSRGRQICRPERWGDPIIVRKEIPTSYHLSVVVDDALQGVTHVVRGKDLEAATDLHVLLQRLLGLPTPRYYHHDLLRGKEGEKLSKSLLSKSLATMRLEGLSPGDIRCEVERFQKQ